MGNKVSNAIDRTLFGPDRSDAYRRHNPEREAYAARVRAGGYDAEELADYERQGGAPVDAAEDAAFAGMANAYARRGIAGGTATAAQGDATLQAAAQRSMNSAQARNQALQNQRRRTLDQYGAETGQWNSQNQRLLSDVEAQAQQEAMLWDALGGLAGEWGDSREQEEMLRRLKAEGVQ